MSKNNSGSGIGLCGLLTIIFIVLKLLKIITWKWIWVLSPLWIEAIICLVVLIVWLIIHNKRR